MWHPLVAKWIDNLYRKAEGSVNAHSPAIVDTADVCAAATSYRTPAPSETSLQVQQSTPATLNSAHFAAFDCLMPNVPMTERTLIRVVIAPAAMHPDSVTPRLELAPKVLLRPTVPIEALPHCSRDRHRLRLAIRHLAFSHTQRNRPFRDGLAADDPILCRRFGPCLPASIWAMQCAARPSEALARILLRRLTHHKGRARMRDSGRRQPTARTAVRTNPRTIRRLTSSSTTPSVTTCLYQNQHSSRYTQHARWQTHCRDPPGRGHALNGVSGGGWWRRSEAGSGDAPGPARSRPSPGRRLPTRWRSGSAQYRPPFAGWPMRRDSLSLQAGQFFRG